MPHLVLVDIDHTLLSESGEPVDANLGALARARVAGHVVVLATARSYIGALDVHRALRLDTPLIVGNGTLVCAPDGRVLRALALGKTARTVFDLFLGSGQHWSFRNSEAAFLHPDFDLHRPHFRDARHYRPIAPERLEEALGGVEALLAASLFGSGLRAIYDAHDWRGMGLSASYYPPSHFDYRESMSVISAAASKGNAARWLQEQLGLSSWPVLAIGDSPDDIGMFGLGTGVAPAGASAEALAAADWIACHCDEGAVASALEHFCLVVERPAGAEAAP